METPKTLYIPKVKFARFKCAVRYKSWGQKNYHSFDWVKTCADGKWSSRYSELEGYNKLLAMLYKKKGDFYAATIFATLGDNTSVNEADYNFRIITIFDNGNETGIINGKPIRPLPFNENNKLDLTKCRDIQRAAQGRFF